MTCSIPTHFVVDPLGVGVTVVGGTEPVFSRGRVQHHRELKQAALKTAVFEDWDPLKHTKDSKLKNERDSI